MPNAFSTVEPVFGIIKEVMGFRRFMLRGFEAVTGEWTLVCIAFKSEASLYPQCVNNRKSASQIRSVAITMELEVPSINTFVLILGTSSAF